MAKKNKCSCGKEFDPDTRSNAEIYKRSWCSDECYEKYRKNKPKDALP